MTDKQRNKENMQAAEQHEHPTCGLGAWPLAFEIDVEGILCVKICAAEKSAHLHMIRVTKSQHWGGP